jgi:hypothetical protein
MVIEVKEVQYLKAHLSIVVTDEGITYWDDSLLG